MPPQAARTRHTRGTRKAGKSAPGQGQGAPPGRAGITLAPHWPRTGRTL